MNIALLVALILLVAVIPWLGWCLWRAWQIAKRAKACEIPLTSTKIAALFEKPPSADKNLLSESSLAQLLETKTFDVPSTWLLSPQQPDLLRQTDSSLLSIRARKGKFMGYTLWQILQSHGGVLTAEGKLLFQPTAAITVELIFLPKIEHLAMENIGAWSAHTLLLKINHFSAETRQYREELAKKLAEDLGGDIQEKA